MQIVIHGPRDVRLDAVPVPEPQEDQWLIRAELTLVSPGTEMAFYLGTHSALPDPENRYAKYPHRPGYASIGRVVGAGKKAERPPEGPILFFGPHASFAILNPAWQVWVPVPASLAPSTALLARLLQIAHTGLLQLRRAPTRVLVLGAGPIGLLAAQLLRAEHRATVFVHDANRDRLLLAARHDFEARAPEDLVDSPPDCVIEATGVPSLCPVALAAVARKGDVVLLGSPRGSTTIDLYKHIHLKNVALIGAHESLLPDTSEDHTPSRQILIRKSLDLLERGLVRVEGFVSGTVTPAEMPEAYARLATDKSGNYVLLIDWQ